jgi:hypothetical protein
MRETRCATIGSRIPTRTNVRLGSVVNDHHHSIAGAEDESGRLYNVNTVAMER